ncbi:acyl-CoA dehydrogenase [Kitasatospora griseola]
MTWAPWVDINASLALTKAMTAWATEATTAECRLRCGVLGALSTSRFLSYQGLGHMLNAGGGDNLLIVMDVARALVGAATNEDGAPVPVAARPVGDPRLLSDLLAVQEHAMALLIRQDVAAAEAAGAEPFEAWNPHTVALRALGETHGQRQILAATLAAVEAMPDGPARAVAVDPTAIYTPDELRRRVPWLVARGLLTPAQVGAIDPALDALAHRLAPHAAQLAEAFAELAELSGSPLATNDYVTAIAKSPSPTSTETSAPTGWWATRAPPVAHYRPGQQPKEPAPPSIVLVLQRCLP